MVTTRPRRYFLRRLAVAGLSAAGLGAAMGCDLVKPRAQRAARLPRIGYLTISYEGSTLYPTMSADRRRLFDAFTEGLRDLGYVDRENITLDPRFVVIGNDSELLSAAAELERLGADVIVAADTTPALAAQRATSSTPIVFVAVGDPVASGLVTSIARPGGNGTGLTSLSSELGAKRLDLLKEAFPSISRLAIIWNSINPAQIKSLELRDTEVAALLLGIELQTLEVAGQADLQAALEAATRWRAQAIVTVGDLISWNGIVSFASRNELPTMADRSEFVFAGGLMAYALSYADLYKRAAVYVDKILKGVRPAELPVERPKRVQLVINLQTAHTLGLTIPQTILGQADQVVPLIFK